MEAKITSTIPVSAALPLLKAIANATGKRVGSCVKQANALLNEFAWVAQVYIGNQPATPQGHLIIARQLANLAMQKKSKPLTGLVLLHQLTCVLNKSIPAKFPLTFKN